MLGWTECQHLLTRGRGPFLDLRSVEHFRSALEALSRERRIITVNYQQDLTGYDVWKHSSNTFYLRNTLRVFFHVSLISRPQLLHGGRHFDASDCPNADESRSLIGRMVSISQSEWVFLGRSSWKIQWWKCLQQLRGLNFQILWS